jgi:UDP-N-acetylglucosamine--N-acetylmuramyl-(pentapeptide) pyrophosphoryl-undecaprenol N-acetylglucosamine transferase
VKILLTGGGTGGHITPILAVAERIKEIQPDCTTVYVGERGGSFRQLTDDNVLLDETHQVFAGKYRRYYGLTLWQKLLDIKTLLLNIRDFGYFVVGTIQAWFLLGSVRPDIVFLKGGFVGVPVGLAAAVRRIPMVTHDSDALPGLANRMVSKWVTTHAVALPEKEYAYPVTKIRQVGVLVEKAYQAVSPSLQEAFKQQIGIDKTATVLLITGGSSGAVTVNKAIVACAEQLLARYPELVIVHQVGKGKAGVYGSFTHDRLQVLEFLRPMHVYMGSADLVVTRGSANTIAELGVQGKAAVVIPSPYLAGGHQLKNAEMLKRQGSAVVVQESELEDSEKGLLFVLEDLLGSPHARKTLAKKLQKHTRTDAAERLGDMLVELAKRPPVGVQT